jgi:hypothetical protein
MQILNKIIKQSNYNTRSAIWFLENYKCGIKIKPLSWKNYLNIIPDMLYNCYKNKTCITSSDIYIIRNIFNNILITNVTGTEIMCDLMDKIISYNPPYSNMHKIIAVFSDNETKLSNGKRNIMHLECLVLNLLYVICTN